MMVPGAQTLPPVTLTLSASDNSGIISQMRFSNDNADWSEWEPYAATKAWTLSTGDGNKTAYVQYKDPAGNISEAYSSTIVLDTAAPVVTASPVGGTFASAQSVSLSSNGPATIYYTTDGTTPTTASAIYSSPISVSATTTIKFIGIDAAGNTSSVQSQTYAISSSNIDLVVSVYGISPSVISAGGSVYVSYIINNIGTSTAAPYDINLYLTTDPLNQTPSDVLIGQGHMPYSYRYDELDVWLTIPSGTPPGTYYIRAVTDSGNTNLETDETNNTGISAPITISGS